MTNEEAIKILKCCIIDKCEDCPLKAENAYACSESSLAPTFVEVPKDVLLQVLELMKEREPRVLTLEEFQASENNSKWLETKDGKHNRWTLGNAGYEKFYDNCMVGYLPIEEYGREWLLDSKTHRQTAKGGEVGMTNAESILTNQRCPKCGSNAVDTHAYKRLGLPWFLCRLCGETWDWNSPPKEGNDED